MENKTTLSKWNKIKRIIAREGLILLVIGLITGGFFYLAYLQDTWVTSLKDGTSSYKLFDIEGAKKEGYTDQEIIEYLAKEGRSPQQIRKIFKDDELSKIPDKKLMDIAGIPANKRSLFYRYDFAETGFYFLIFTYPSYLLVRFIIWAIKTLRERA
ncbi:MAG: hypothetical protein WA126_04715 [Thermodesulfovibrionales bacterium]